MSCFVMARKSSSSSAAPFFTSQKEANAQYAFGLKVHSLCRPFHPTKPSTSLLVTAPKTQPDPEGLLCYLANIHVRVDRDQSRIQNLCRLASCPRRYLAGSSSPCVIFTISGLEKVLAGVKFEPKNKISVCIERLDRCF